MGMWDGSAQASQFSAPQRGLDALFARLEKVEKLLRDLRGADILSAADIKLSKGGMTIASELLVTGDTVIQGTLSLPAGVVDNDALTNPVVVAPFYKREAGFATPNSYATLSELLLATPEGFTKAAVIATGWARLKNTSGSSPASFVVGPSINGVAGPIGSADSINAGNYGIADGTTAGLVTGLASGALVPVRARGYASPAFSADATSEAVVTGIIFWLR